MLQEIREGVLENVSEWVLEGVLKNKGVLECVLEGVCYVCRRVVEGALECVLKDVESIDGCVEGCVVESMDGCVEGCVVESIDGCTYRWQPYEGSALC